VKVWVSRQSMLESFEDADSAMTIPVDTVAVARERW
jgi:hypothetical protein